ncbi:hypothetical protein PP629_gp37 [Streptomyces phage Dubu]|uniref:Uncharacterized protein n=1 Tax=Streptomyces phage Dubu TaxID=2591226 RepID=A0A514DEV8_9CAUD|nr:hypothetical protein PP629_gp37 [Streptomyces phage Dubu]QDH92142.1 hypothetical protein SEA_DUBU_37 [Streptomyces phage Dubu]
MSDLEGLDPNHVCGDGCQPYVPLIFRDLEDLEESDHIDALYDVLNRTREHGALLFLALNRVAPTYRLPARTAALLLDLDEAELDHELGHQPNYALGDVVAFAVESQGTDGYVGKAMEALFRLELGLADSDDEEDDEEED